MSQDNKPKPAAQPLKKGSAYVAHAGARAVLEHPPEECPPAPATQRLTTRLPASHSQASKDDGRAA